MELLRGDMAARAAFYSRGILDGWLVRNEAREMEDLDPIEGLDLPLRPLNMGGGAIDMTPIGKWTSMAQDGHGLLAEGFLFDTPRAKDVWPAVKAGELDGLSIGFKAPEWSMRSKAEEPRRTLKKVGLYELSLV